MLQHNWIHMLDIIHFVHLIDTVFNSIVFIWLYKSQDTIQYYCTLTDVNNRLTISHSIILFVHPCTGAFMPQRNNIVLILNICHPVDCIQSIVFICLLPVQDNIHQHNCKLNNVNN